MPNRRHCAFVLLAAAAWTAATASAQRTAAPEYVIGGAEKREAVLGVFRAALVIPGFLVVLDADAPFLKVFDHRGLHVQTIGARGTGPGQFRDPSALAFDAANKHLIVTDREGSRVTRFDIGVDSLTFRAAYAAEVRQPQGACVVGRDLYLLGDGGNGIVHEMLPRGAELAIRRSVGTRDSSSGAGRASLAGRWHLGCDERTQRAIAAGPQGSLYVIDLRSGEQTAVTIPNFRAPVAGRAGAPQAGPDGWWHEVVRVSSLAGSAVLTTAIRGQPPVGVGDRGAFEVATVTAGGVETTRTAHAWQPVGRAGTLSVCAQFRPVPVIAFFARAQCP